MFKNSLKKFALYPMEIVNNCPSLHYQATNSVRSLCANSTQVNTASGQIAPLRSIEAKKLTFKISAWSNPGLFNHQKVTLTQKPDSGVEMRPQTGEPQENIASRNRRTRV